MKFYNKHRLIEISHDEFYNKHRLIEISCDEFYNKHKIINNCLIDCILMIFQLSYNSIRFNYYVILE